MRERSSFSSRGMGTLLFPRLNGLNYFDGRNFSISMMISSDANLTLLRGWIVLGRVSKRKILSCGGMQKTGELLTLYYFFGDNYDTLGKYSRRCRE